ncbi:MAG: hypothetical protein M1832_001066 [Thelocarpon impressellum]|nr:MAG: hypothetical protein M1832_001066 [Thelocarpon impressellum]
MAPSSGHLLVPLAMRIARIAFQKTSEFVRAKLPQTTRTLNAELQPILVRNGPRHPIHRAAYLRQSKGRWYTTHSAVNATLRRFTSTARAEVKYDRASLPRSTIGTAVTRLSSRAPFAHTLRPNLTGGALPRTAGGYSTGTGRLGGARHFSHTPAAPAEVVNNVSAAVRAFWLSGQKAQYDGVDSRSGGKRFKAVTALQDEAGRKMRSIPRFTPGSSVDFHVSPTITALSPLAGLSPLKTSAAQEAESLNADGLLDMLSRDFARAVKDMSIVLGDLKSLAALGDLRLTTPEKSTVRVHFPGCDVGTVRRLCDEVGVRRGVVRQDEGFDAYAGTELALLFPFAPSTDGSTTSRRPAETWPAHSLTRDGVEWRDMMSPEESLTSQRYSTRSDTGIDFEDLGAGNNPWASSPSGYLSVHGSDEGDEGDAGFYSNPSRSATNASEYEGIEGIHRFLSQCDGWAY